MKPRYWVDVTGRDHEVRAANKPGFICCFSGTFGSEFRMDSKAALLLSSVFVVACAGSSPEVEVGETPGNNRPVDESTAEHPVGILDQDDRCPEFPGECYDGFDYADDDGCPDPGPMRFVFASDSQELSPEALRRLAFAADQSPPFAAEARVQVRAHAASVENLEAAAAHAALVARTLVERGFPEAQLVVAESHVAAGADPLVVTVTAECSN